jgi:hypothetical protein
VIPLSLLFVLSSLGLLVWGLAVTSQALVWGSLAASIAAGVCLTVSVVHRRGQFPAADAPPLGDGPRPPVDLPGRGFGPPGPDLPPPFWPPASDPRGAAPTSTGRPPETFPPAPPPAAPPGPDSAADAHTADGAITAEPSDTPPVTSPTGAEDSAGSVVAAPQPAERPLDQSPGQVTTERDEPDTEPPVEDVPVGVALRAAQLDDEVLVVDGRPRYHLAGCPFLTGRPTVGLPLSTARRTGFTPCGICRPDSTLLARARGARGDQSGDESGDQSGDQPRA